MIFFCLDYTDTLLPKLCCGETDIFRLYFLHLIFFFGEKLVSGSFSGFQKQYQIFERRVGSIAGILLLKKYVCKAKKRVNFPPKKYLTHCASNPSLSLSLTMEKKVELKIYSIQVAII